MPLKVVCRVFLDQEERVLEDASLIIKIILGFSVIIAAVLALVMLAPA